MTALALLKDIASRGEHPSLYRACELTIATDAEIILAAHIPEIRGALPATDAMLKALSDAARGATRKHSPPPPGVLDGRECLVDGWPFNGWLVGSVLREWTPERMGIIHNRNGHGLALVGGGCIALIMGLRSADGDPPRWDW
ncbi:MAG: hypothetical protein KF718_31830 [Polyangiaceae bacterium]|nr:hypothetical protein [Polyangiaceae bacterium]